MNKKTILSSLDYAFYPASKTINFYVSPVLKQEEILLIINNTASNRIIYNFACNSEGGVLTNNILTLNYDTTTMAITDNLTVIISEKDKTEYYLEKISNNFDALLEILIEKQTNN